MNSYLLSDGLRTGLAAGRPGAPILVLLLALAVSACAGPGTAPGNDGTPLTVFTAVGSQPPQEADRYSVAPPAAGAPAGRRALPPIPTRPGHVDATESTPSGRESGERTMLNFNEADLYGVVRALAQFTGRNFVVDPRVKGQLTLVSDAPVDADTAYAMLLAALRMQGFAVVDVDGVNRVVPEADAKMQGGVVVSPGQAGAGGELVTRVFSLHYEDAADLVPVLRPMVTPNNTIVAEAGANALVITDYADNLARIAEVIARIDTPMAVNTDVIPIEYGVALDVAALAQQLMQDGSAGKGRAPVVVVADPRSNTVLVRASTPERLRLARDLILRIDTPETRAGNLHVVYLRNAQATHLAEVLRGALTGQGGAGTGADTAETPLSQAGAGALSSGSTAGGAPRGATQQLASMASMAPGAEASARTVAFSAGGATVQADPTTNTLIISAPDPLYRSLREVIDQLDQRRAQVLIESLIVEVNAEKAAEFGVQWSAGGNSIDGGGTAFFGGANLGGTGVGSVQGARTTIDALGAGLSAGMVRGTVNVLGTELLNLGVLARAMQRQGGVNVLSTPNLMTLDNEQATIIVGNTVPFVTGTYTTSGDGASNPFQTVQREDVGLTLRIRPQISEGGTVKLSLYQEVSSIDPASSTPSNIITRKRALETKVLVDDGQIIVLGGLLEDVVNDTTSSVPLLGDIPGLGNLFKYQKRTNQKTNLMLFLRPHIVRTARDGASLTLDRYNYMRAAQLDLPVRASWLLPEASTTSLPAIRRDPDSGLLDLRPQAAPDAGAAAAQ
ncbi:type II secretion system secretin GspD [Castellaniella sp. GW247-6E4]|uniref:type II secretion system secretin GspD n=1 Tax=Castellaniella sp. GW247-6E4 TaxID=3140380 RepID=UPI0033145540